MNGFVIQSGTLYLQVAAQLREEGDRRAGLEVRVKILLKLGRHHTGEVSEDAGSDIDFTQHIHLVGRHRLPQYNHKYTLSYDYILNHKASHMMSNVMCNSLPSD